MKLRSAHNLPVSRTSLIGRERDIAETRNLLLHGRERLLTLTGMGGCGKTRLALEVANSTRDDFPDGVFLIEAACISDPLLLQQAVATALGIPETPSDAVMDMLVATLQSRTLLIVMDNCEHLIDACASLADRLLLACPGLRILATSREPLLIAAERRWRVPPLGLPVAGRPASIDELSACPAVQLFVERAAAVEPSFRLEPENADAVAQICTMVGGLPLGIELAAAWAGVLSAAQILSRLDDCQRLLIGHDRTTPARHQTLWATLDWSYHLLPEVEQAMFRRVAVLTGGWGLEAAEAVCAGDCLEAGDVLGALRRLVDKSLVLVEKQNGETRYRLLEPVRQYANHLLEESGELDTTQACLTAYCIGIAERAAREFWGPRQAEWQHGIDRDLDNIRAALYWADARNDAESLIRLAGSLYGYFWMRGHLREGRRWLEAALARDAEVPIKLRARATSRLALLCLLLDDWAPAMRIGLSALALCRKLGDARDLALITQILSHVALELDDTAMARSFAEESVAFARRSGSRRILAHVLVEFGHVVYREGDVAGALQLHEEALSLLRTHGDYWAISFVIANLVSLREHRGNFLRAIGVANVRLYWKQRDHQALAAGLEYLACKGEAGYPERQVRLLAAACSLRTRLGAPPPTGDHDDVERCLSGARAALGESRFAVVWAEGRAMSLEQVVAGALTDGQSGPASNPGRSGGPSGLSTILTQRERQVAELLARGLSNHEIAEELTITHGTAKLHVHNILNKLGFRSRAQIADCVPAG